MNSRTSSLRTIGACLIAITLAGCARNEAGHNYLGLAVAKPQSQEILRRHSVYFATDSAVLTDSERDALMIFLRTSMTSPSATVRVLGHADERATDRYNLDLSARRSAAVADYLGEMTRGAVEVERSHFGERVPAALGSNEQSWKQNRRVEVVIRDYAVQIPSCPNFDIQTGDNIRNAALDGLGCANASNLARMIADPADLAHDRPILPADIGSADAMQNSLAIDRYRKGEAKELEGGGGS
ncbi:MAG: OmpA family protein [Geminicoccaceae bacterium]